LIFLGNGAPEGNIFKEIQEKKKEKSSLEHLGTLDFT
jgi:hypothetical protein